MTAGQVQTYLHAPLSPAPSKVNPTAEEALKSRTSTTNATSSLPLLPKSASPVRAASRSTRPPPMQSIRQPLPPNLATGPAMSYSATQAAASMFVPAGAPQQSYSQQSISHLPQNDLGSYVQNQSAIGGMHRSGENMEEEPTVQDKVVGRMNDLLGQAGRIVDQANRIIK